MALEIKLAVDSLSADGDKLTVKDVTGAYSFENPGGYGTLNPERGTLLVFLLADRVTSHSRRPLTVTGEAPSTAAGWGIGVKEDGVLEMLLVATKEMATGRLYLVNEVRAYGGTLYRSKALQTLVSFDELSDPAKWTPVVKVSDYPIGLADTGSHYNILNYLHSAHTELCRSCKTLEISKAGVESMDFERLAVKWLWQTVNLDAAVISAGFGDFAEAGDALEEAGRSCGDSNCGC